MARETYGAEDSRFGKSLVHSKARKGLLRTKERGRRERHRMEENMETKSSKKTLIAGGIVLVALIAVFAIIYSVFREKPVEGTKSISIEVVNKAQESATYELTTNAEYLRQAMEEADGLTFSGTESAEFGMMVDTVNGETADWSVDASYWAFYVNGEYAMYGIDQQPVEDGDAFSIVYTISE